MVITGCSANQLIKLAEPKQPKPPKEPRLAKAERHPPPDNAALMKEIKFKETNQKLEQKSGGAFPSQTQFYPGNNNQYADNNGPIEAQPLTPYQGSLISSSQKHPIKKAIPPEERDYYYPSKQQPIQRGRPLVDDFEYKVEIEEGEDYSSVPRSPKHLGQNYKEVNNNSPVTNSNSSSYQQGKSSIPISPLFANIHDASESRRNVLNPPSPIDKDNLKQSALNSTVKSSLYYVYIISGASRRDLEREINKLNVLIVDAPLNIYPVKDDNYSLVAGPYLKRDKAADTLSMVVRNNYYQAYLSNKKP